MAPASTAAGVRTQPISGQTALERVLHLRLARQALGVDFLGAVELNEAERAAVRFDSERLPSIALAP